MSFWRMVRSNFGNINGAAEKTVKSGNSDMARGWRYGGNGGGAGWLFVGVPIFFKKHMFEEESVKSLTNLKREEMELEVLKLKHPYLQN